MTLLLTIALAADQEREQVERPPALQPEAGCSLWRGTAAGNAPPPSSSSRSAARPARSPGASSGPAPRAALRFLVSGEVVVTRPYGEEKPQSVRNLAAPTSFGASTFALGIDRSASVVRAGEPYRGGTTSMVGIDV